LRSEKPSCKNTARKHTRTARSSQDGGGRGARDGRVVSLTLVSGRVERRVARRASTAGARRRAGWRGCAGEGCEGERETLREKTQRAHSALDSPTQRWMRGERAHGPRGSRLQESVAGERKTSARVPSQGQKYVIVTCGGGEAKPRKHNQSQHTRTARSSQNGGGRGARDGRVVSLTLVSSRVERRMGVVLKRAERRSVHNVGVSR
jgi:hypothetical protein